MGQVGQSDNAAGGPIEQVDVGPSVGLSEGPSVGVSKGPDEVNGVPEEDPLVAEIDEQLEPRIVGQKPANKPFIAPRKKYERIMLRKLEKMLFLKMEEEVVQTIQLRWNEDSAANIQFVNVYGICYILN